jgi:hypothetical protein
LLRIRHAADASAQQFIAPVHAPVIDGVRTVV